LPVKRHKGSSILMNINVVARPLPMSCVVRQYSVINPVRLKDHEDQDMAGKFDESPNIIEQYFVHNNR